MRRAMSSVVGVSLLLLALLVAGCSDDDPGDDPTPSPPASSLSTSPSPSPSPTATSSAPPEGETPVAFIRRWIEVHTAMQNDGDTAEFRKLSKGCQACLSLADQVDEIYANGGFVETDGWTPGRIKRIGGRGRTLTYLVDIDNPVTRYSEREGGKVITLPAGSAAERFVLRRLAGGYVVSFLAEQSTP